MSIGNIEYARLLISQGRHAEAEKKLKETLADYPEHWEVLYLYAHTLILAEKYKEAEAILNKALAHHPDNAILFYGLSTLELHSDHYDKALEYVNKAIAMEPWHSGFFAVKSEACFFLKKYELALEAAEEGLLIDAEDTTCLNMRANALHKLGRMEEAHQGLEIALEKEPDNAYTFANMGWKALENKQTAKSLEYFKESLRLNASYDYAKEGMKEALKARYLVYRWFLDYSFWIDKHGKKASIGFAIAFNILYRIVKTFSVPLALLLFGIFLSLWLITPIADAFLLFHPLGKYAMSKKEKLSSGLVVACLALCLSGVAAYGVTGSSHYLGVSYAFFFLAIPAGNVFNRPQIKWMPATLAILSCIAAFIAVGLSLGGESIINGFTIALIILVGIFTWVA